jgi:predicted FMN-binding regulatory protein PaiB
MTKKELEAKVVELERRIAAVEGRPVYVMPYWYPQPQTVPIWTITSGGSCTSSDLKAVAYC